MAIVAGLRIVFVAPARTWSRRAGRVRGARLLLSVRDRAIEAIERCRTSTSLATVEKVGPSASSRSRVLASRRVIVGSVIVRLGRSSALRAPEHEDRAG
jgi:hypothetical protein